MTKNQEKELKIKIDSERNFALLLDKLGTPDSIQRQTNYYFDSSSRKLWHERVMLRLRTFDGKAVLTIKGGANIQQGYFQCDETEEELLLPNKETLSSDKLFLLQTAKSFLVKYLPQFDSIDLLLQGSMSNTRHIYAKGEELWEIDHTIFSGGREDFEIEVETLEPERVERELRQIFAQLGIAFEYQTKTKYRRFLENLALA